MSTFALTLARPTLRDFLTPHQEGAGADLIAVEQRVRQFRDAYHESPAITYRETLLTETFSALAREWREAVRYQSSLMQAVNHPAYRAVVELGDEIVPQLLRELRRNPEPWFLALREITGVDPARPEHRGNLRAIADAWVRWGRERGLV